MNRHSWKALRAATSSRLLLLLFTFAASSVQSAEWVQLKGNGDDDWRAYDITRTALVAAGKLRTWKRYKLKGHESKYPGYEYSITEWEIDCAGRRQRILASFDYSVDGRIVNTDIWDDQTFRPIPPGSLGDIEAAEICERLIQIKKQK